MRVISGLYKGRHFDVPRSFKARPTTDFAKENLFNVLTNLMDFSEGVTDLDLFAGTGSISLELLSRGCDKVVSIEKDRDHYQFINKVMREIKTSNSLVLNTDVFKYLQRCNMQFDFIFADPPYDLPRFAQVPELVLNSSLVHDGTLFIMEHPREHDFSALAHFLQQRVYGKVNFSLFDIRQLSPQQ